MPWLLEAKPGRADVFIKAKLQEQALKAGDAPQKAPSGLEVLAMGAGREEEIKCSTWLEKVNWDGLILVQG